MRLCRMPKSETLQGVVPVVARHHHHESLTLEVVGGYLNGLTTQTVDGQEIRGARQRLVCEEVLHLVQHPEDLSWTQVGRTAAVVVLTLRRCLRDPGLGALYGLLAEAVRRGTGIIAVKVVLDILAGDVGPDLHQRGAKLVQRIAAVVRLAGAHPDREELGPDPAADNGLPRDLVPGLSQEQQRIKERDLVAEVGKVEVVHHQVCTVLALEHVQHPAVEGLQLAHVGLDVEQLDAVRLDTHVGRARVEDEDGVVFDLLLELPEPLLEDVARHEGRSLPGVCHGQLGLVLLDLLGFTLAVDDQRLDLVRAVGVTAEQHCEAVVRTSATVVGGRDRVAAVEGRRLLVEDRGLAAAVHPGRVVVEQRVVVVAQAAGAGPEVVQRGAGFFLGDVFQRESVPLLKLVQPAVGRLEIGGAQHLCKLFGFRLYGAIGEGDLL